MYLCNAIECQPSLFFICVVVKKIVLALFRMRMKAVLCLSHLLSLKSIVVATLRTQAEAAKLFVGLTI